MEPESADAPYGRELEYEFQQALDKLAQSQAKQLILEEEINRLQRSLIDATKQVALVQHAMDSEILAPKLSGRVVMSVRDKYKLKAAQGLQLQNREVLTNLQGHLGAAAGVADGSGWNADNEDGQGDSTEQPVSDYAGDPAAYAQAVETALTGVLSGSRQDTSTAHEGSVPPRNTSSIVRSKLSAASIMHKHPLDTPELLGRIFSYLSPRDTARACCVCRTWRCQPLRADMGLWRRLASQGGLQPSIRGPLWESILLSSSSRTAEQEVVWPASTLLELAAIGEALDMQSLGTNGKGRAPLRGRTLLKLYTAQACHFDLDASTQAEPEEMGFWPLSLESRSGRLTQRLEHRLRLRRMPRPQPLSLDPATDGTPHEAGQPVSARIYTRYLAAGRANEKASCAVRNVKEAASAVRVARASVAHATETIHEYANRGEPMPADMTVEFASCEEETARVEAAFSKCESEARVALAGAHTACQAADAALVTSVLESRRQHALAVGRAWTAACARGSSAGGQTCLVDPVTGKIIPTAGLRLPPVVPRSEGPTKNEAAGGISPVEGLSIGHGHTIRGLPANVLDMVDRALSRGNLSASTTSDISPFFPLPIRLTRLLHQTAMADVDLSEESRLGLAGVPIPFAPPEPDAQQGATLHSTPAAAPSLIRLDEYEGNDHGGSSRATVELPAPPYTSQHLLIDADVKRTFGDIDSALRAAESMVEQRSVGGDSDSPPASPRGPDVVLLSAETILPTSYVTCPRTPQGGTGITRDVLMGLRGRLHNNLLAHAAYDRGVGYCQGQNFLGGMLLRHMSEPSSFWGLAALCHSPAYALADAFSHGLYRTGLAFAQLSALLSVHRPKLSAHLSKQGVTPDMYATAWVMTLWAGCWDTLPLTHVAAVWDAVLVYGWKAHARVFLALLDAVGPHLMAGDLGTIVELLHTIPRDKLPPTAAGLLRRAFRFKVTNSQLARMAVRYDQMTHPQRWADWAGRKAARQQALEGGQDHTSQDGYGASVTEIGTDDAGSSSATDILSPQTAELEGYGEAGQTGYSLLGGRSTNILGLARPLGSMGGMAAAFNAAFGRRDRSATIADTSEAEKLEKNAPSLLGQVLGVSSGNRSRSESVIGQQQPDQPPSRIRSRAGSNTDELAVIRSGSSYRAAALLEASSMQVESDSTFESPTGVAAPGMTSPPGSCRVLSSSLSAFVSGIDASEEQHDMPHRNDAGQGLEDVDAGHRLVAKASWFRMQAGSGTSNASPGSPSLAAAASPTGWATFSSPTGLEVAFSGPGAGLAVLTSALTSRSPRFGPTVPPSRPLSAASPGEFGEFASAQPSVSQALPTLEEYDGGQEEEGGSSPGQGDKRGVEQAVREWPEDGGVQESQAAGVVPGPGSASMSGLANKLSAMLTKASNSLTGGGSG